MVLAINNKIYSSYGVKTLNNNVSKIIGEAGSYIITMENGERYFYGTNYFAEYDFNTTKISNYKPESFDSFENVDKRSPIKIFSAGKYHKAVITESDEVYVCGLNDKGQCIISEKDSCDYRKSIRYKSTLMIPCPTKISFSRRVLDVQCGTDQTLFVFSDGTVFSTDRTKNAQFVNLPSNIVKILLAPKWSCFVTEYDDVYVQTKATNNTLKLQLLFQHNNILAIDSHKWVLIFLDHTGKLFCRSVISGYNKSHDICADLGKYPLFFCSDEFFICVRTDESEKAYPKIIKYETFRGELVATILDDEYNVGPNDKITLPSKYSYVDRFRKVKSAKL